MKIMPKAERWSEKSLKVEQEDCSDTSLQQCYNCSKGYSLRPLLNSTMLVLSVSQGGDEFHRETVRKEKVRWPSGNLHFMSG